MIDDSYRCRIDNGIMASLMLEPGDDEVSLVGPSIDSPICFKKKYYDSEDITEHGCSANKHVMAFAPGGHTTGLHKHLL